MASYYNTTYMEGDALIANISDIYKRISHAAMRAGRRPEDVRLIAVTKTVPAAAIKEAVDAGLRDFGESRVKEAEEKAAELAAYNSEVRWHMVGHLQRNKARAAVGLFDLIHSIDSVRLLREVGKEAERTGKLQRVLVEVKLSPEEAKHGVSEEGLMGLLREAEETKGVEVEGLMAIPPFFDDPRLARPYFKMLRMLRDEAERAGFGLPELSMGMTGDFEIAVEEGATIVRIGTAIFGPRRGE